MSIDDFFVKLENFDILIAIYSMFAILMASILWLLNHKEKEKQSPMKYVYSVLIYAITVPGIIISVITGYKVFVEKMSLLDLNFVVFLLPIISMIITLVIISKDADLKSIPGFDRLSGLMTMLGISVVIAFVISRAHFWIFSSIAGFFLLILVLFLIFKFAAKKFIGKRT